MNNPSNERLKDIAAHEIGSDEYPRRAEWQAMASELLAYREATGKVVAYYYPGSDTETEQLGFPHQLDEEQKGNCLPLYTAPQIPAVHKALLRELVDVVWQDAKESAEVPSTSHADKLILQVFGNSEQVNSFREIDNSSTKHFRENAETSTNS